MENGLRVEAFVRTRLNPSDYFRTRPDTSIFAGGCEKKLRRSRSYNIRFPGWVITNWVRIRDPLELGFVLHAPFMWYS